jgi:acyl-coenzyme A synthetase/AMP-(fatty) acid ligase
VIVVGEPTDNMTSFEALLDAGDASWHAPDIEEHAAAFLGYTSGTTGRPKGVLFHTARSSRARCARHLASRWASARPTS